MGMATPTHRNYEDGSCDSLAAAIWEIAYLPSGAWRIAIFEGSGAHVTAVTPDGQYIDSLGPRTEHDIRGDWYNAPTIVDTVDDLVAEGWQAATDADDYRAALAVLEQAGLADDDVRYYAAEKIEELED